jgi:hypothetical protein
LRVRHPAVERLDGESVIGLGDEPLVERRALEHVFDQLAPLLAGGRGKFGRQRELVGRGCHHHKLPRSKRRANNHPSDG